MQVTRVGAASENDPPLPMRLLEDLVFGSMPLLASRLRERLCSELQGKPINQVKGVTPRSLGYSASTETGMQPKLHG
jgi:hypothetical protein